MRKIANILIKIVLIVFAAIVAITVFFVACSLTGNSKFIPYEPRIVVSGSMEPTIPTGSMVIIDKTVEYNEVAEGDVIAFLAREDFMVTHRVINITDSGMETQGDNNEHSDGISTTGTNYYGKIIYHSEKLGDAIVILREHKAQFIIITVAACVGCISILSYFDKKIKPI